MKNIAIFASGSGTNAESMIQYFQQTDYARVNLVLSNRSRAYVLERARKYGISCLSFNKQQFYETDFILKVLQEYKADILVLAGFLWLVPNNLLKAYPNKIVNIHPALLPKYGGQGMYGAYVHSAVIAAGEKETGITIHYVNENYDEGQTIFQATCPIEPNDTPDTVLAKVRELEHRHFSKVVGELIMQR